MSANCSTQSPEAGDKWGSAIPVARLAGIEPATPGFGGQYSIH